MEELKQPVSEIIKAQEYRAFIYKWTIDAVWDAFRFIEQWYVVFPVQQTVKEAWNRLCGIKPKFCGWLHEHPNFTRGVLACENKDNPCCGHLNASCMFHTIGVGGFLAQKIDPAMPHPSQVIERIVRDDNAFQFYYGVSIEDWYGFNPIPASEVPVVRRKLQMRQMETYYTVTRPYIVRVGEVLRNQSR